MDKYVYIIHSHDKYYKIGIADDISARIYQLQHGNPMKLTVVREHFCQYAYEVEQKVHEILASRRVSGEWFILEEHQIEVIFGLIKHLSKYYDEEYKDGYKVTFSK